MPVIIIIAGPNGAGKTTFAKTYFSTEDLRFEFVNADEIARIDSLEGSNRGRSDIRAGRMMLDRIDKLVDARANFAIETTLANLTYARKIPVWREQGYVVSLIYLRLGSAEEALSRIRQRVTVGGHDIPEDVVKRRFRRSEQYFESIYKPIVDSYTVQESRAGAFVLVDSWPKS